MTVVVEQYKDDNYYISLSIENRRYRNEMYEIYIVQVCPCHCYKDSNLCGYPEKEISYPISEKKKAYATYRRYIRKYCR